MKQSQIPIVLAGVGLCLLLSGFLLGEDPVVFSQWAALPLDLDGLAAEWASDALLHFDKVDLDCGFKNDGRNLFILLIFRNPKFLSSIDSAGITIRGGPKGISPKNNGVKFVKRILSADQYISTLENQGVHLTASDKDALRNWSHHFLFAAYAVDKKGKIIPVTGSVADLEPAAFRTRRRQDVSTYEFRLPLTSREAYPAGIEAEPGQAVSVFFEWGGSAKKALSPRTSWSTPWSLVSGGAIADNDETRAQEFLNSFDPMSRPSLETKKYAFRVDVQLAKPATAPDTRSGPSSIP